MVRPNFPWRRWMQGLDGRLGLIPNDGWRRMRGGPLMVTAQYGYSSAPELGSQGGFSKYQEDIG
uniref:Uncharacterized protein n=1 Tax=Oryza sativa subsp. japonica TaxID=39947 RepID=Q6Z9P3_ORYSJ|nr:hypothetical protein [Oryza sativa Japonica Group]